MLNFIYILNALVYFRMNHCVAQCEQHSNVFTLDNSQVSKYFEKFFLSQMALTLTMQTIDGCSIDKNDRCIDIKCLTRDNKIKKT